MLFSSPIFLFAFLPVTLAGYYLLDRKFKNIFLLIMSLIFYAWGEPKFIFIMLISIMANWLFGLAVDKFRDNKRAAHGYLTLMVERVDILCLQVSEFYHNQRECAVRHHIPADKIRAAHRHIFLYLSGDVICYRRLQGQRLCAEKSP